MTEAVRKQLEAAGVPVKRTSAPRPPKPPPAPVALNTGQENAKSENLTTLPPPHYGTPGGPCTWLLPGGQALSLAGPVLGPDRMRVVVTGPRNLHLLAALLEAAGVLTEMGGKPC